MAVQLTDDQLTTLINRLVGAAGGAGQGAASAVGPMEPCNLGIDKVKRLRNFQDWCKEAEAKITYMGITEDTRKVALLKSWAGRTFLNFWKKEARIHLEKIPRIPAAGGQDEVPEIPADTYENIIKKTKVELLKHVSRDRSLTDLLQMKQGDNTWLQVVSDVELGHQAHRPTPAQVVHALSSHQQEAGGGRGPSRGGHHPPSIHLSILWGRMISG